MAFLYLSGVEKLMGNSDIAVSIKRHGMKVPILTSNSDNKLRWINSKVMPIQTSSILPQCEIHLGLEISNSFTLEISDKVLRRLNVEWDIVDPLVFAYVTYDPSNTNCNSLIKFLESQRPGNANQTKFGYNHDELLKLIKPLVAVQNTIAMEKWRKFLIQIGVVDILQEYVIPGNNNKMEICSPHFMSFLNNLLANSRTEININNYGIYVPHPDKIFQLKDNLEALHETLKVYI
jgi:hypothetical protein